MDYESLDIEFLLKNNQKEGKNKNNPKKKSFEDIIKDYEKIDGIYDFYWDEKQSKCYLSIHPNQLNKIFLASFTRQSGDGYRYDGSSMLFEFPYSFNKIGANIQLISENVLFRANKDSAIYKAIDNHISNSIFSVTKIEAINFAYKHNLLYQETSVRHNKNVDNILLKLCEKIHMQVDTLPGVKKQKITIELDDGIQNYIDVDPDEFTCNCNIS